MNYTVQYDSQAVADLKKLPPNSSKRIINKIDWLAENFEEIKPVPLLSNLSGFYKLRVGDYRVIYSYEQQHRTIVVEKVGHRREIYK